MYNVLLVLSINDDVHDVMLLGNSALFINPGLLGKKSFKISLRSYALFSFLKVFYFSLKGEISAVGTNKETFGI